MLQAIPEEDDTRPTDPESGVDDGDTGRGWYWPVTGFPRSPVCLWG